MNSSLFALSVNIRDFGAKGDGSTDDRKAIQLAIVEAGNKGATLIIPNGNYLLKGGLTISSSLDIQGSPKASLIPFGVFTILSLKKGNIKIEGITIDAQDQVNGSGMTGVLIDKGVNVEISKCRFINWAHGSGIRYYSKEGIPPSDITISETTVTGADPVSKNISPVRWYSISIERVSSNLKNEKLSRLVGQVEISNCNIQGGYYGINLIGISGAIVKNNTIKNVMRGISLQRGCVSVLAKKNNIQNCRSSGILIGYASNQNTILKNSISSNIWVAEALIKVSVNCNGNLISRNRLTSLTAKDPGENFISVSLMCNNTTISRNTLIGKSRKPAISVEAIWDNKTKDPDQFGYGKSVTLDHLATGPITGVVLFKNNLQNVKKVRANQPYIYINEGAKGKKFSVTNLELKKNRLPSSSSESNAIKHSGGDKRLQN